MPGYPGAQQPMAAANYNQYAQYYAGATATQGNYGAAQPYAYGGAYPGQQPPTSQPQSQSNNEKK